MTTFSTGIGIALLAACIGIGCLNGETTPFSRPPVWSPALSTALTSKANS